jgi:hypothetical protein
MKSFQDLLNFLLYLVGAIVVTYVVSWVVGPYYEYMDNVRCGLEEVFLQIDSCIPRFLP